LVPLDVRGYQPGAAGEPGLVLHQMHCQEGRDLSGPQGFQEEVIKPRLMMLYVFSFSSNIRRVFSAAKQRRNYVNSRNCFRKIKYILDYFNSAIAFYATL